MNGNGIIGICALAAAGACGSAHGRLVAEVDFAREVGRVNPELHSSGWTPRSSTRAILNEDDFIKSMGLSHARTHDWSLVNGGQRVVDYYYLFPLFDKDPKDPSNYVFGPTDHLLEISRNAGLKTYFRLGASIEHTDGVHFNTAVPSDLDKVAEIFAATVRHYNRGWANGKEWDIRYWEIWNEPDGIANMWCKEGVSGWENRLKLAPQFAELFVKSLVRIKSEFPEVKVGGPGLSWLDEAYARVVLDACRKAGVQPDFFAWHYYGKEPDEMIRQANRARELLDEYGFADCEPIIDEWHYILSWDGIHGRNSTAAMVRRALDGPTGHNNIDSAAFVLTALSKFQSSPLKQAYYYGGSPVGNWGYMNHYREFNKVYYGLRLYGELMRGYETRAAATSFAETVTPFAVKAADGACALLLTDYRGVEQVLRVAAKGIRDGARVRARILDHGHDDFPCDVTLEDGVLTLVKPDKNSAAFLVTFR